MGSRGCGKTTLLKMLTPASLSFWKGEEAESVKRSINFTAIYIPSDIQWKNQFDYLNKYLNGQQELVQIITQFLFASNVQIAICKTFHSVIFLSDKSDSEKLELEFDVSQSLAEGWGLTDNIVPTLDNIEIKILERIRIINSLVKQMIFKKKHSEIMEKLPSYVFDGFFDQVKIGCKVFSYNFV